MTSDGRVAGRLADLTVRLDNEATPTQIERIMIRRNRSPNTLIPWTAIQHFDQTGVVLHPGKDVTSVAIASTSNALGDAEILLKRDVLDTQIIDVVGQRLARVADVVLTETGDGGLELVGVDVGFAGVVRRLGLRRLTAPAQEDVVAWTDLHLTSERGHAIQLATPRSAVNHLDVTGLATLVSKLNTESATEVITATTPATAADVIRASHPVVAERVLRALPDADVERILAAMPAEHTTHWHARVAHTPTLFGRRFIRSRVWPRRGHLPPGLTAPTDPTL